MVVDHVYNYRHLPLMALFDKSFEVPWRAISGLDGEELHRIVAPIVVRGCVVRKERILSDRQHFNCVDAETLQVIQLLRSARECLGERSYVQLIDHHRVEGGLRKRRHIKSRVHDYGSGLIVVAGQAIPVGQVKSGQLLGPGIVELARDASDPNYIAILVSCLCAGHRTDPSGVGGIGVTWL